MKIPSLGTLYALIRKLISSRIRIVAQDPVTNLTYSIFSDPIRVLSKPSQVAKYLCKKSASTTASTSSKKRASSSASNISSGVNNSNGLILEALARLEQSQAEQRGMLDSLLKKNHCEHRDGGDDTELFNTFTAFINCYNRIDRTERPSKVRKLLDRNAVAKQAVEELFHYSYTPESPSSSSNSSAEVSAPSSPTSPSASPTSDLYSYLDSLGSPLSLLSDEL